MNTMNEKNIGEELIKIEIVVSKKDLFGFIPDIWSKLSRFEKVFLKLFPKTKSIYFHEATVTERTGVQLSISDNSIGYEKWNKKRNNKKGK